MLLLAGRMLVYPRAMFDYVGFGLLVAVVVLQKLRTPVVQPAPG